MKLFKVIMAGAVLSSVVMASACSSSGKQEPVPSANQPSDTKPAREKLKLRAMLISRSANANLPSDKSKDFVRKAIEDKFQVELDINYMVNGPDLHNKMNAMAASNDLPDFWLEGNPDGGIKLYQSGLLSDLTPFVTKETMPNYFKYWLDDETMRTYRLDGKLVRIPIPYDKSSYRAYYIRKDWLDKLGLKVPQTYEDYVKVLQAFTNNDPDGNNKKDTYGATYAGNGNSVGLDWPEYIKNGMPFPVLLTDTQIIDAQTDPKVEQVIDDIAKVIGMGVIDPDWFLSKGPDVLNKASQGKVGVVLGGTPDFAFDSSPQSLQARSKMINPQANWVAFSMFGPNTPIRTTVSPGSPILFSKATAEKSPEKIKRAVEIVDWLVGDEGFLLTHYGLDGKHYTRTGNQIKLNIEAFEADVVKQGNFLDVYNQITPIAPHLMKLEVVDPRQTDHDREITKFMASLPIAKGYGMAVTPPQGFDLGSFRARQNEMQVKLVMEEKSGKNWPKIREELMVKYKGQELLDAYTKQLRDAGKLK
ncbi:extracellular solute-binding protein [Paenibacillus mesophilus]|uniref:extracellular solute-binding protein n=1 Tax=Paenibacillus mesophilus TaxID=2582849 RepID=UPI00110E18D6|nr:extracellular solute-binding protein [Paenibacillus mesophilus]TMV49596.1 extracellular solute-binding protein [Paenibacillus mesophilus]